MILASNAFRNAVYIRNFLVLKRTNIKIHNFFIEESIFSPSYCVLGNRVFLCPKISSITQVKEKQPPLAHWHFDKGTIICCAKIGASVFLKNGHISEKKKKRFQGRN